MTFLDQSQSFNNGTLLIIGILALVKLYIEKKYGVKISDNIELLGLGADKFLEKIIEKGPKLRGAIDVGKSITGDPSQIPGTNVPTPEEDIQVLKYDFSNIVVMVNKELQAQEKRLEKKLTDIIKGPEEKENLNKNK